MQFAAEAVPTAPRPRAGALRPETSRAAPLTKIGVMPVTLEQLLAKQRAQPFRPYRIHLAAGRHVDVAHPEFLARSPSGRTATVYTSEEGSQVIDLLLVTSLEDLNGRAARRRKSV